MKLGIFVDTTNLYHTVYRKFQGKLCYEEYYEQVVKEDAVVEAVAYGMGIGESSGFANCLNLIGFDVKFKVPKIIKIGDIKIKRCDWGVGMAMDIVNLIDVLDIVVIGSSDSNLLPLVNWIKRQGVEVKIVASLIPRVLKEAATCIEIPEDWLEEDIDEDSYDNNRTVNWGESLRENEMEALKNGEIFTLLSAGRPISKILMDSYEIIREQELSCM